MPRTGWLKVSNTRSGSANITSKVSWEQDVVDLPEIGFVGISVPKTAEARKFDVSLNSGASG
jgi:hypothetical protein